MGVPICDIEYSYFWGLFQGLGQIPAETARKYSEKNNTECLKIWYIPYSWLHGLLYSDKFDDEFAETFYTGSWFDGVSQEEMLRNIKCPTVYIKTANDYGPDGVLLAANTEEDAALVQSLIPNCEIHRTATADHDVHFVYADEFVRVFEDFWGKISD